MPYAPTLPVHSNNPDMDELRLILAPQIAQEAVFDGWTDTALANAVDILGVDAEAARFAFADGPLAMVEAWISHVDAAMIAAFPPERIATMKIRERIGAMIRFRLEHVAPDKEALRRATAILARPGNAARTARISWRTADLIWRLAGDTATDYNHYTKRLMVSGVYGSTLAVFLDDDSDDHAETWGFLDRRIDNVMQIEKVKAQLLRPDAESFSLARLLGRMRYPAR